MERIEIALEKLGNEEVNILTKEEIIDLHDMGIEKYGGSYGIRDENLLESISISPYQSCFGQKLYPDIYTKAAYLLYNFANQQVFIDGNKRTSILSSDGLLKKNGFAYTLTEKEIYDITIDIANHKIESIEELSNIIQKNTRFLSHEEIEKIKNKEEEKER